MPILLTLNGVLTNSNQQILHSVPLTAYDEDTENKHIATADSSGG